MKRKRVNWLMLVIVAYSLSGFGQDTEETDDSLVPNPISISVETGHNDPDPTCKIGVEACPRMIWTAAQKFQIGSKVWLKVTVTNHSGLVAVRRRLLNGPWNLAPFAMNVIEDASGTEAKRTKHFCRMFPSSSGCPPPDGSEQPWKGSLTDWAIRPGESIAPKYEITFEYDLAKPGRYTLSAALGRVEMTAADNYLRNGYRDRSAVQYLKEVRSSRVQFRVVK